MNIRLRLAPICLPTGQAALLDHARGASIHCRAGSVWVTQEGEQRDVVLERGESIVIERDGMAVVSALHDASVEVQPAPADARPLQALRSGWRRLLPQPVRAQHLRLAAR